MRASLKLLLQESFAIAYKSIEKEDCLLLERCLLSAFCFAIRARAHCFAYFAMLCSDKLCAALCCLNLCENLRLIRIARFASIISLSDYKKLLFALKLYQRSRCACFYQALYILFSISIIA